MGFDILPQGARIEWEKSLADHGLTVEAYAAIEYLCRLKITSPELGYEFDGRRFGSAESREILQDLASPTLTPRVLLQTLHHGVRLEESHRPRWRLGLDGILVEELDERIHLVDEYNARVAAAPEDATELRRELNARIRFGGRRSNRLLRNREDHQVDIQQQGFEYFSLHLAIGEYLFTPYFQILEKDHLFRNRIHVFLSKRFKHDHGRLEHLAPFFETEAVRNRLKGKAGEILERKAREAEPRGRPSASFYEMLAEEAMHQLRERRSRIAD